MHNQRNRRAAQARSPRSNHKVKRKQRPAKVFGTFPSDVTVPPHCGTRPRAIDFSPLVASPFAMLSAGFVALLPSCRLHSPPAPVRRSKPSRSRLSSSGRPKRPSRGRQSRCLRAEPLVERSQAVVVYREGGLLGPLGHWLGARAEALLRWLGGVASPRPPQSRKAQLRKAQSRTPQPRKSEPADQIQRLVAENDRLKAQLEALLAQHQAHPRPVSLGARESVKQHSP